MPSDSGYRDCACRDCFELVIGPPGTFCDGCKAAGCPDYQGQPGMSQECQREDAYGCGEEED
mgnify:CR=1 FL=1